MIIKFTKFCKGQGVQQPSRQNFLSVVCPSPRLASVSLTKGKGQSFTNSVEDGAANIFSLFLLIVSCDTTYDILGIFNCFHQEKLLFFITLCRNTSCFRCTIG